MAKIISRKIISNVPQKINRFLKINDFWDKHNKILILRAVGGLGDILMHRMMFEDFKLLMPTAEVHFACPIQYHEAVQDHPFIDKLLSCDDIERTDYIVWYNTSTACVQYEARIAPKSDLNRSDIWATHCGIKLTKHNMHIRMTEKELKKGQDILESHRNRPGKIVLMSPVSSMQHKNLLDHQLIGTVQGLYERGFCVIGIHDVPIPLMMNRKIPQISELSIRQWMSVIHEADYIVSVDTSTFHCAGGMGKPVVGVFTFATGDVYGRYYKNSAIVQEGCPLKYNGCYNWTTCPCKISNLIPCLTDIKASTILRKFDNIVHKITI